MTGKKTMGSSAAGTASAKRPRATRKATKAKDVPVVAVEDEEEEQAGLMTLSMEEDTLECDICCLPFESQVFMCKNGHSGCANCCLRMNGKCWTCPEPMGDIRCRPLEKLLAAATTSCNFRRNGCYRAVRLTEKLRHEETCPRAPYDCPVDGCAYSGLRLCHHVAQDHGGGPDGFVAIGGLRGTAVAVRRDAPFRLLLQRDRDRVFLLLNGRDLLQGRSLSLLCLGPRPEGGVELEYEMEVAGGELSLSVSGTVPCARRLEEGFQAKGFLFVPDAYWGSSGTIDLCQSSCLTSLDPVLLVPGGQ